MPTSVLLAVLVAAGLLAFAPALTRRYDATERIAAERATSTARVLSRRRRRRTVPGPRPINPPRALSRVYTLAREEALREDVRRGAAEGRRARTTARSARSSRGSARTARPQRRRRPVPTALHRRRRVFLALVLLNLVELTGVLLVGPGFWIGFSVSFTVFVAYVIYLRRQVLRAERIRRARRRRMAWIAAQQAAVRREHIRRAAERQAAARRIAAAREAARRQALEGYVERYTPRAYGSGYGSG